MKWWPSESQLLPAPMVYLSFFIFISVFIILARKKLIKQSKKLQPNNNILAFPKAGWGNCLIIAYGSEKRRSLLIKQLPRSTFRDAKVLLCG